MWFRQSLNDCLWNDRRSSQPRHNMDREAERSSFVASSMSIAELSRWKRQDLTAVVSVSFGNVVELLTTDDDAVIFWFVHVSLIEQPPDFSVQQFAYLLGLLLTIGVNLLVKEVGFQLLPFVKLRPHLVSDPIAHLVTEGPVLLGPLPHDVALRLEHHISLVENCQPESSTVPDWFHFSVLPLKVTVFSNQFHKFIPVFVLAQNVRFHVRNKSHQLKAIIVNLDEQAIAMVSKN